MSDDTVTGALPGAEGAAAEDENELRQIRLEKLGALKAAGHDPFAVTTAVQTAWAADVARDFDTLENDTVTIRDRDTMLQERVAIADLDRIVSEKVDLRKLLKQL